MPTSLYYIINEKNEDRLSSADNLQEAIRIARKWAVEGQLGDPIGIEHEGLIIRQLIQAPDGELKEMELT